MARLLGLIIIASMIFSCQANKSAVDNQSQNESHYHIQWYEREQPQDRGIVVIKPFTNNFRSSPLNTFLLNGEGISKKKYINKEKVVLELESGNYSFDVTGLGFYLNSTPKFYISQGDSAIITFYSKFKPLH